MRILGLDFETTGFDPHKERVLEIGAVVWDTDSSVPLATQSEILSPEGLEAVPKESQDVHGISMEVIKEYGIPSKVGFERLIYLLNTCEFAVAHNAKFDRSFFEAEVKRLGISFDTSKVHWIDTMTDILYPESITTRKLSYLAAEHGFLNHHSHRALTDVLAMLGVLKNYDIQGIIERSMSPTVHVVAKVTFEEKDLAKAAGFRWNPKQKAWFKELKEMDLEKSHFPFELEVAPSL